MGESIANSIVANQTRLLKTAWSTEIWFTYNIFAWKDGAAIFLLVYYTRNEIKTAHNNGQKNIDDHTNDLHAENAIYK
jgi:hypothetical protein